MAEFLNWIHEFLTVNLNSEANYQRKYLSLMLYDVVLRYLNGGTENLENRRKGLCRKGNLKSQGMKVCEYLMKENQWKFTNDDSLELLLRSVLDPTNDVRELAVKIMVEYFVYSDFQDAKQIVLKSFGLCNSTTTHETECGALYMVLLLQLQKHDEILGLMNEVLNTKSRTIIECLTNLLEQQYVEFEQDCVKAILNHKPMYGILTALKFLINNCTLSEAILNTESLTNLVQTTEKISQFCLNTFAITAPKTEYLVAPSFSEMDDAVTFLISNSKSAEEIDCSNIYQDVFNSLWMTLRLCTDISSALANTLINGCEYLSNSDINSNEVITRCSQIIVSALTRCRHKGVIEGAGLSLANFIRNLTKVHPESKLPEQILEKHIFSTLTSTYKGPSMTRRGAGMGILFHRLISSDNRDNKPLLKHAMTNLLMILKEVDTEPVLTVSQSIVDDKNLENIEGSEEMAEKSQSEVSDVIEASVLHYVKGLVQDSSLKVDLAPYMSELTGLAFKYFFAPSWPIRNGALQLFGAIVPKFIGQKKGVVGTLDDTAVEIPPSEGILHLKMNYLFIDVGELLLHYPELRQIIYTTLTTKIEDTCNVISNHACLVPVLSLLSGAIVGLTTSYDDSLKQTVLDFQVAFVKLFSSPIQVVRNLAAKCYVCLTPLREIQNQIIYLCKQLTLSNKENFTHGALLGLAYLVDKFLIQGSRNNQIDIFLEDKVKCVNTIINLLQDENVDIRNEMTNFYSAHLKYNGGSINPTFELSSNEVGGKFETYENQVGIKLESGKNLT
ncbi:uncharacterized protein LOC113380087 [Ctenocephalides felis]|uniref:uncharacterized protein LOC113380087 n=1 Tax=Ctenocephalides felis TaxID=7515 RepID=UPI000E6E4791|nr:uncharacterized protein LOC113380087 [Ctenocephalides felis]